MMVGMKLLMSPLSMIVRMDMQDHSKSSITGNKILTNFVPLHCSGPCHSLAWHVSEVCISSPFLDITQGKEEPDNKQRDSLGNGRIQTFAMIPHQDLHHSQTCTNCHTIFCQS